MPLIHVPNAGEVLMCDFEGFKPPEMVKTRRVVVVSPRPRRGYPGTYIIVPISKTPPLPPSACHREFSPRSYAFLHATESVWAKADMVCCVASTRLDRMTVGSRYCHCELRKDDLEAIKRCVLHALGMRDWRQVIETPKQYFPEVLRGKPGLPATNKA